MVEHQLDTLGVASSSLAPRTTLFQQAQGRVRFWGPEPCRALVSGRFVCRRLSHSEPRTTALSLWHVFRLFPNTTACAVTKRKSGPTPKQKPRIAPPNPPATSKPNSRCGGDNASSFSACTPIAVGRRPNAREMVQPKEAALGSAAAEANGERSDCRQDKPPRAWSRC